MNFKTLKVVVVDEADFFFEKEEEVANTKKIYEMIDEEQKDVQKLFFSATYPEKIKEFIKEIIPANSIKIELPTEKLTLGGIKQFFYRAKKLPGEDKRFNAKLRALVELFGEIEGN